MGKTRICGKRCHHAKTAKCRCWCGGMFHGEAGTSARWKFANELKLEKLPTTEDQFRELTQPRLFDNLSDGNETPRASWRDQLANHVGAQQLETIVSKRRLRRPRGE